MPLDHVEPETPAEQLITITFMMPNKIVVERFCPTLNEWTLLNEFQELNVGLGFAAVIFNNELVLLGGSSLERNQNATNNVISINLSTMKRRERTPTLLHREAACAAVVEGILYYLGGKDLYSGTLDEVECWDPKIGKWDLVAPLTSPKSHFAVAVLDGRLYACGGCSHDVWSRTMEYYDPKSNTWYPCAPMFYRRSCFNLAVLNNLIYAVGGYDPPFKLGLVERYHPETNTWMQICSLNVSRSNLAAVNVSGHLWAIGGRSVTFLTDNRVEVYDLETNTWLMSNSKIVGGRCVALMVKVSRVCFRLHF